MNEINKPNECDASLSEKADNNSDINDEIQNKIQITSAETTESEREVTPQRMDAAVNHALETDLKASEENLSAVQNQPTTQQAPAPVKKKSTAKVAVIIILIAVIAMAAEAYFLMRDKDNKTANTDKNTILQSDAKGDSLKKIQSETYEPTPESTQAHGIDAAQSTPVLTPVFTPQPTPKPTSDGTIHVGDDRPEVVVMESYKTYTIGGVRYDAKYLISDNFDPQFSVSNNGEMSKSIVTSYSKVYAVMRGNGNVIFIAATTTDEDFLGGLCVYDSNGIMLSSDDNYCSLSQFCIKKNSVPEYSDGKLVFNGYFAFLKKFSYSVKIDFTDRNDIVLPKKVTKKLGDKAYRIKAIDNAVLTAGKSGEQDLAIKKGDIFTVEKFLYESNSTYVYINRQSDDKLFCLYVDSMGTGYDMLEESYNARYDPSSEGDAGMNFYAVDDIFREA